jgi:stage II sporulation protein AB (anti-sigma F factor)
MKERRKPTNELRLVLPSHSVNESLARSLSAAFVSQVNPTVTELSDIKCAVSEAVTNCIVHGYANALGMIYITMKLYDNREFRIEIKDKGRGIPNLAEAMQPLYTTDKENERSGMGFTIMESFMTNLEISSAPGKGTTVHMRRRIARRQ